VILFEIMIASNTSGGLMLKKVAIFILGLILCVAIIIYLSYLNNRVRYPLITENAQIINYYDNTDDNPGNRIDKGVEITYTSGHISSDMRLAFHNYKPYKRLEMYEDDGVFIIIYDEENEGERKDRLFTVNGASGYHTASNGQPEYNVLVYKNGKQVRDVVIKYAEE